MQKLEIDKPLYIEPIIGYRSWRLEKVDPYIIRSSANSHVWKAKEIIQAECKELKSPHLYHSYCGIYSNKQSISLLPYIGAIFGRINGTVYQWGHIIEHEHGYRSEYAYPRSFDAVSCGRCGNMINGNIMIHNCYFLFIFCSQCAEGNAFYEDDIPLYTSSSKLLKELNLAYGL